MMSSNSSSTDPAEEFPEVDDYSEVDDLDLVAAELAAELRSTNGQTPEAPVEPVAADHRDGSGADPSSPERMAAALADQVGLDLNGDSPIASDPVDVVEQGPVGEGDGHPVAGRAGWFPPVTDPTDNDAGLGVGAGEPVGNDAGSAGQPSETFDRPPSSPPIERAPLAPEPPAVPEAPRVESQDDTPAGQAVDQIAVRKLGGFNFLSIGQWSTLPRDERARLLKGGLVMFLYEGEEVPVRPALLWLQQMARSENVGPDERPTRRRGR